MRNAFGVLLAVAALVFVVAGLGAHVGSGIFVTTDGRIYFADTFRDVVWRVDAGTLAPVQRGVHTNHLIVYPGDSIAVPADGYLPDTVFGVIGPDGSGYRVDRSRILRRAADGSVSLLAGDTVAGFADGAGHVARFRQPQGMAVDSVGALYVADYGNKAVRRVTSDGRVSTVARTNGWRHPTGIGIHGARVYVLDRWGNYFGPSGALVNVLRLGSLVGTPRVSLLTADGELVTIAEISSAPFRGAFALVVVLVAGLAAWTLARRFTVTRAVPERS